MDQLNTPVNINPTITQSLPNSGAIGSFGTNQINPMANQLPGQMNPLISNQLANQVMVNQQMVNNQVPQDINWKPSAEELQSTTSIYNIPPPTPNIPLTSGLTQRHSGRNSGAIGSIGTNAIPTETYDQLDDDQFDTFDTSVIDKSLHEMKRSIMIIIIVMLVLGGMVIYNFFEMRRYRINQNASFTI